MAKNRIIKKLIKLLILIVLTAVLYFLNEYYVNLNLNHWVSTFFSLSILYFSYQSLNELIISKINDAKARYSLRKIIGFIFVVIGFLVLIRIWTPDPQSLVIAYGLVGAGVAVSLQDFFKNLAGGLFILFSSPYKVGDRIEINNTYGDVMDIGIMNTTMLEIRNWVNGDQATGRLTIIPNSYSLSSNINNYTKDHNFIWDELKLPLTYDSDWKKAITIIEKIITKLTKEDSEKAEKQIEHISERYYLSKRNIEPNVYVTATDNWIELGVRYITLVRDRRLTHAKINEQIIEAIQAEDSITIASATFALVEAPEIKVRQSK